MLEECVGVMNGTDPQGMSYTPDIKIKNLKYTNLLNNPVMAKNGIWTEKKDQKCNKSN